MLQEKLSICISDISAERACFCLKVQTQEKFVLVPFQGGSFTIMPDTYLLFHQDNTASRSKRVRSTDCDTIHTIYLILCSADANAFRETGFVIQKISKSMQLKFFLDNMEIKIMVSPFLPGIS